MKARFALLVVFALSWAQGGRKDRPRHKQGLYRRRFPKPETWMLYSSKYDPIAEETGCIDLRGPKCEHFANNPGYCHYSKAYMKKWCRKSCKWCMEKEDRNPVRSLTQPLYNGGSGKGILNGGCEDLLEDCSKYIRTSSDCDANSALTRKYCARTCGHCCSDQIAECALFIKHPSQCNKLNGFFRKYCAQTCKFCGPPRIPVKKPDTESRYGTAELVLVTPVTIPYVQPKGTAAPTILEATTDGNADRTKCQQMGLNAKPPLLGAFYPACKENGEFEEKQCWGSTGYCWCVDKDGNEITGTKVQFKQLYCGNEETAPPTTTTKQSTVVVTEDKNVHTTKEVTNQKRQKDIPATLPTEKTKPKIKSTTKTRSVPCEDRLKICEKLVAKNVNYCTNHVDYMKEYCRRSCKFCGPTVPIPKCKDKRKRKCKLYSKFQGYCTVYRKHMRDVCPKSCGFCGVSPEVLEKKISYMVHNEKYEFAIKTKWDGSPINHDPIKFKLSAEDSLNVRLEVSGPFFDQPGKPPCLAGQPCWKLWEYEVAEVFFLGEKEKYLELEVSPYGPHLLLLLDGIRKPFKTKLPMRYSATIDHNKKTWNGTAIVPIDYFPPKMRKINGYAIHGPDGSKVYESLYPAKNTNHPDFHQLQFFQDFDFKSMFTQGWKQPMSPFWVDRL